MTDQVAQIGPTFVLIHGAFRTGWSWHGVIDALDAHGRRAVAVELRGMGVQPDRAPFVTMTDWVDDVAAVCQGLSDVTLVGHSMGGVVAQAAASRLGERLRRLMLLDAPIVHSGQRAVDVSSTDPPDEALLPPRSTVIPARPVGPAEGFDDVPLAELVNARLVPTPFGPSRDVVDVTLLAGTAVDVVFCERTPAVYPSAISRARCDRDGRPYVVLDCHHDAPLLAPGAVAALLCG
jgi:pimeloyl-ACP methyl ester carboxylesterase